VRVLFKHIKCHFLCCICLTVTDSSDALGTILFYIWSRVAATAIVKKNDGPHKGDPTASERERASRDVGYCCEGPPVVFSEHDDM